jgi:hypothetical protein
MLFLSGTDRLQRQGNRRKTTAVIARPGGWLAEANVGEALKNSTSGMTQY